MKIEVKNVSKSYRHKEALKNISFTMEGPKIIGFLGHNGACIGRQIYEERKPSQRIT